MSFKQHVQTVESGFGSETIYLWAVLPAWTLSLGRRFGKQGAGFVWWWGCYREACRRANVFAPHHFVFMSKQRWWHKVCLLNSRSIFMGKPLLRIWTQG